MVVQRNLLLTSFSDAGHGEWSASTGGGGDWETFASKTNSSASHPFHGELRESDFRQLPVTRRASMDSLGFAKLQRVISQWRMFYQLLGK